MVKRFAACSSCARLAGSVLRAVEVPPFTSPRKHFRPSLFVSANDCSICDLPQRFSLLTLRQSSHPLVQFPHKNIPEPSFRDVKYKLLIFYRNSQSKKRENPRGWVVCYPFHRFQNAQDRGRLIKNIPNPTHPMPRAMTTVTVSPRIRIPATTPHTGDMKVKLCMALAG